MIENIDYIVCQICKKQFRKITGLHLKLHNINMFLYRQKFPNAKLECSKVSVKKNEKVNKSKKIMICQDCNKETEKFKNFGHKLVLCDSCKEKRKTKENKRRSKKPKDYIECLECGKFVGRLNNEHLSHHNLTVQEYKIKHPLAVTTSENVWKKSTRNNKTKGTKIEKLVEKVLISLKVNFVKNSGIFARPDLLVDKLCIFADGDYWHCNPNIYSPDYYNKKVHKLAKEIWEIDKQNNKKLKSLGYMVLRFWEYDLNRSPIECIKIIEKAIGSGAFISDDDRKLRELLEDLLESNILQSRFFKLNQA